MDITLRMIERTRTYTKMRKVEKRKIIDGKIVGVRFTQIMIEQTDVEVQGAKENKNDSKNQRTIFGYPIQKGGRFHSNA